jgi:hypothetical protein
VDTLKIEIKIIGGHPEYRGKVIGGHPEDRDKNYRWTP